MATPSSCPTVPDVAVDALVVGRAVVHFTRLRLASAGSYLGLAERSDLAMSPTGPVGHRGSDCSIRDANPDAAAPEWIRRHRRPLISSTSCRK